MADVSASGNGSSLHQAELPTHSARGDADTGPHHSRRRRHCICLAVAVSVLVLLAVVVLVLFLTVLRVRDPTTRVVSARVDGVAPSVAFPPEFNVTLFLTVAVHNPNRASFSYASGQADLTYHGNHVGDAEVDPGNIPSRGDGVVELVLTVQADRFTAQLAQLISDVGKGEVPLDSAARIPGTVTAFGVFKLHAVAYSDCHVVFGVPELAIRSQECHDRTRL